jgi:hypothetical protein
MSHRTRLTRNLRRALLPAVISLILFTTAGAALTAWSAHARSQAAPSATDMMPEAPAVSGTPELETEGMPMQAPAATQASATALAAERPTQMPAFTITWERTATSPDGLARLLRTTKRYQRSDGVYKLVQTHQEQDGRGDSRVEIYYGFVGLGVFRFDAQRGRLIFFAPQIDDRTQDVESALRADPRFDREEDVWGQRAVVLRTSADGAGYAEEYRALSFGGLLIKRVEDSGRGREVWEPTNIEMGEPDNGLFADLFRYPADYTHYEQTIQRTERDRQQRGVARIMRELMSRMKVVKAQGR